MLGLLAIAAFMLWWYSVPDARAIAPSFPAPRDLRTTVIKGAGFVRLAGLTLLPVTRTSVVGALLVLTGVGFLTGGMQAASFWLLETFPALARLG